ncbi:MAG: hypothetical protein JXB38_10415 [Anaerolineales bacterium]|nr:hypothetical protein [Anaerolineales bacterium]
MAEKKLTRRDFFKIVGLSGIVIVPAALGYRVYDLAGGEELPDAPTYAFSTGGQSDSLPAPGQPLLLLDNDLNAASFGAYLGEILRAEGINQFQMAALSAVDMAYLEQFQAVILTAGELTTERRELISTFVERGGKLVAMQPDRALATAFGLDDLEGKLEDGYMQVSADHPLAAGIETASMQFHGGADLYQADNAQVLAWLSRDAEVGTVYPAVYLAEVGQGQVALWTYDLARSVAYTRQGNPALAGVPSGQWDGLRAVDMFVDGWIDLERVEIPQADEQQRLFANVLTGLLSEELPLMRLWYFPGQAQTMVVVTSDSHENPGWAIEDLLTQIEKYGGHGSIYYSPTIQEEWMRAARRVRFWLTDIPKLGEPLRKRFVQPTPGKINEWRERGHEFGIHPYVGEFSPEPGLETGWDAYYEVFTGLGYGPISPTVRTHRVLWDGWVKTGTFQASHGFRMNMDYYHWGPLFQSPAGEWLFGHFTGSGLPMKFVDENGQILNLYQQLTHLADDHMLNLHWGTEAGIPAGEAVEISKRLIDQSLGGYYSAIVTHFHTDPYAAGEEWRNEDLRWLDGTLGYAVENDVPIWSTEEWLAFTEMRQGVEIEAQNWNSEGRKLHFTLSSVANSENKLTIMLPSEHAGSELSGIEIDDTAAAIHIQQVGGTTYTCAQVEAGTHAIVAYYNSLMRSI